MINGITENLSTIEHRYLDKRLGTLDYCVIAKLDIDQFTILTFH